MWKDNFLVSVLLLAAVSSISISAQHKRNLFHLHLWPESGATALVHQTPLPSLAASDTFRHHDCQYRFALHVQLCLWCGLKIFILFSKMEEWTKLCGDGEVIKKVKSKHKKRQTPETSWICITCIVWNLTFRKTRRCHFTEQTVSGIC